MPLKTEWTDSERRRVFEKHFAGLGENFFGKAKERVSWLEDWAQRDRMREETAPNDVRGFLHFAHREANLGQEDRASEEYLLTLSQNLEAFPKLLERALELFRQGRTQSAKLILELLNAEIENFAFLFAPSMRRRSFPRSYHGGAE